jgi:hypothetical protein
MSAPRELSEGGAFLFNGALYCWECVLSAFELGGYGIPRSVADVDADLGDAARTYELDASDSSVMPVRATAEGHACARCGDPL